MIWNMQKLKRFLIATCVTLATVALTPMSALARQQEPEREIIDARLEGYATNVALPESTTALTWLLFAFLGVVCLSVLFKDAKRTHLD